MFTPEDTELVCEWKMTPDGVRGDEVCDRIEVLISSHFIEIAKDKSGWKTLYRDPTDERLWERIYPRSELHGGGPPTLRVIDPAKARLDYGF